MDSAGASQLSSSSSTSGGGVDDGIVRGVEAARDGTDVETRSAGVEAVDAPTAGSASHASSSSGVGGGHDNGIERDKGAAADAGGTDGDGIPIKVPPLPVLRDGGAAEGVFIVGGGSVAGAGIPINVCCLFMPFEIGGELFATGAADGSTVNGGCGGGFDPGGAAGTEGGFDARSSLMASSADSSSTSDGSVDQLLRRAT